MSSNASRAAMGPVAHLAGETEPSVPRGWDDPSGYQNLSARLYADIALRAQRGDYDCLRLPEDLANAASLIEALSASTASPAAALAQAVRAVFTARDEGEDLGEPLDQLRRLFEDELAETDTLLEQLK